MKGTVQIHEKSKHKFRSYLTLESMQAALSWNISLNKRNARAAYACLILSQNADMMRKNLALLANPV